MVSLFGFRTIDSKTVFLVVAQQRGFSLVRQSADDGGFEYGFSGCEAILAAQEAYWVSLCLHTRESMGGGKIHFARGRNCRLFSCCGYRLLGYLILLVRSLK